MRYHEVLREGASDPTGLARLDLRLDNAQHLVIAWIAQLAQGRDFDLDDAEVIDRFGPDLGGTAGRTPPDADRHAANDERPGP